MINRMVHHLLLTLLLTSFSAHLAQAQRKITREEYIQTYKDWAIEDMKHSGIPASIKLAQALLESADGNSELAKKSNNHFGIKCHGDWNGGRVYHHDDARNECFRVYDDPLLSFEDHTTFLTSRSRYQELFDLDPTDYKGWAHGLKKAGYATNPQYPSLLIKIIEENQLYLLDQEGGDAARKIQRQTQNRRTSGSLVINPYAKREVLYNNGVGYIELQEGDTYEELTKTFELRNWELSHYNDLPQNPDLKKYRYLYIEAKRRRAHPDHPTHIVKEGETMHLISQMYGVRIGRLYHYNLMEKGEEPQPGEKINLRKKIRR